MFFSRKVSPSGAANYRTELGDGPCERGAPRAPGFSRVRPLSAAGPPVRSTLKSTLRKSLQKACQYASLTRHKNSPTCTLPNRYSEVRTDARVRRVSGCLPGLARIDRALDKQRNRFLRLRPRTRSRRRPRQLCCLAVRPPAALAVHAASSTAGACSPASAAHSAP